MRALESWIVALNRALVAIVLAMVFAIVFINVVGRYGFNMSFAWAEEVARHLMILGAFSGAGLALREGRLVAIDTLPIMLPRRYELALRWAIVAVMFIFMGVMGWLGIRFVEFGWDKETMSTGISRGIPYLAIPIGCALFLVQLAFFAKRFVAQDFEIQAGVASVE
ncbi:TRAP transporter small permease [Microbaculum sp. FT89]|uniref:TRAP transporter small permease n=1 Tax=Microbaculum sp. FT89 TaxID=3447298 RepID=UPI003F52D3F6